MNEPDNAKVQIITKIEGIVLPPWVAICLVTLVAIFGVFIYLQAKSLDDVSRKLREVKDEIRILQLHARDIESVLIRSGEAHRNDFAPWRDTQ